MFWDVSHPAVSYTVSQKTRLTHVLRSATPSTRIMSAKTESALLHVNYANECAVVVTCMAYSPANITFAGASNYFTLTQYLA
jgi:hypothetical protein